MARLSFILPVFFSIAAFVLSLLVLMAGKDPNFLTSIYLLRIDTANIRASQLEPSTFGIDLPPSIDEIVDKLPDALVDNLAQTAAKQLGLRDFYTAHVMTFCEGMDFLTANPNDAPNATEERVTYCSNPKGMFNFDPIKIFEAELVAGVSVEDLGIPQEVETGVEAVGVAYKVMFIAYIVGVALAGVVIILSVVSGWYESRLVAFLLGLLSFVSLLALIIASGIGTAIAVKLRDVFNEYMVPNLNVSAHNSPGYLGMTWASVAGMLVTSTYWAGMCCFGRGRKDRRREKERRKSEEGFLPETTETTRY